MFVAHVFIHSFIHQIVIKHLPWTQVKPGLFLIFNFWLCWVFVAVRGLSLVAASEGYSSLRCAGFSLQ